jgi:hypothetical protein
MDFALSDLGKIRKEFVFLGMKWCAQGDDFRTFLAEFVPNVQLFEIPSELSG